MVNTAKGKAATFAEEATPAAGEDNNKHLAFLQSEDSRLRAYLTEKHGADFAAEGHVPPVDLATMLIDQFASGVASAHEQAGKDHDLIAAQAEAIKAFEAAAEVPVAVDAIDKRLADAIVAGEHELLDANETPIEAAVRILSKPPGDATDGEIAAIARAEKLEARVTELEGLLEDGPGRDLAGVEIPPAKRADAAECGPLGQRSSSAEIKGLIDEGHVFELVFSDGDCEIVEFEPVQLAAADLYPHGGGRLIVVPVVSIAGPRGEAAAPIEIDGAALLVNGEQVDYCPFDARLTVNPGDQRQFSRAFTFGGAG